MKIKVINPNTTASMTASIGEAARLYARTGTDIIAAHSAYGPASIESFFDEYLAIPPLLEAVIAGDREEGADAFVIACFGDPGLWAAREVTSKPVIGIAEAAIATAKFLAPNFSIVIPMHRSRNMCKEVVRMHGAEDRCLSIRTTDLTVLDFDTHPERGLAVLAEECRKAVKEDKAECVLLGCAGFVTFVDALQRELGVPVLDGVSPAVKYAEMLVDMGCSTSKSLTWAKPDAKRVTGYSQSLTETVFLGE